MWFLIIAFLSSMTLLTLDVAGVITGIVACDHSTDARLAAARCSRHGGYRSRVWRGS